MSRILTWCLAYVVPSCILIGGVFGIWNGGRYLWSAYRSSKWPQAEGMVIRSELASISRSDSNSSHSTESFWPEVEYKYQVDGKSYTSTNIKLDGLLHGARVGTGEKEAEEVLARYPLNAAVTVYYDPEQPGEGDTGDGGHTRQFLCACLLNGLDPAGRLLVERNAQGTCW